jgi:AcrR family transcriptional regulator
MQIDKRKTILKVSKDLFSRFGLVKTTVDEIAKLARIGKGTVYHYFKSKEDIFAEVIQKDLSYYKGLVACGDEVARLTNPIWEKEYIGPERVQVEKRRAA